MMAKVKYQIDTYAGEIIVNCGPDDEQEYIIARAKKILRNKVGSFPPGYQNWTIIERC